MAWNRGDYKGAKSSASKATGKRRYWHGIVAGLIVIAVGIAALYVLSRREPSVPKPAPTAEAPRRMGIKDEGKNVKPPAPAPVVQEAPKKPSPEEIRKRREEILRMTPEERYQMVMDRFRKVGLPDKPRTNKLFRTSLENKMAAIFTTQLGDPAPVFPPKVSLHDEAFLAEILLSDNPIVDSDDERQRDKKEAVKLAKAELIKFIKEGGDPNDFLEYYQGQLQQAHKQYMDARKSIFEIMRNDPEIAGSYIKKVNATLRERGIKEIIPPQKALDAFGVVLEEDDSNSNAGNGNVNQ